MGNTWVQGFVNITSEEPSHKFDNIQHKEKCCPDFLVTSVVTTQKLHDFLKQLNSTYNCFIASFVHLDIFCFVYYLFILLIYFHVFNNLMYLKKNKIGHLKIKKLQI